MRIILIMMTLVCMATSAWAATYYVSDGTGNDGNAGTAAAPYKTIAAAYARAGSGDTIIVKPGIYREYKREYGIHINKNGIILKSEVKWGAIIDGGATSVIPGPSYYRSAGFYLSGNNNTIDGFDVRNNHHEGINNWGSFNMIINNHVHDNAKFGDPSFHFGHDGVFSSEGSEGNRYIGNYIHNNGRRACLALPYCNLDHGMYLCGSNELVVNNIIVGHPSTGIQIAGYDTVRNTRIYNNTIAFNGQMPWNAGVLLWKQLDGVIIKNNILYKNVGWGVGSSAAHGSGVVIDGNIIFGNTVKAMDLTYNGSNFAYTLGTNPTVDPLFWNPTAGDFGLKILSPAIDAGLTLAEVPQDFLGRPRPNGPAYDLGVFEGSGSHSNPVPDVTGGGGGSGGGGGGGDPTSPPPCCVD